MSRFVLNQVLKIKNLLSNILPKKLSKYHYLAFFVSSIVLVFIFSSNSVGAQGSTDVFGGIGNWVSGALLTFANLAILLSIFFLKFFIHLASYNNYIDVNVVKIGWVMVRDVANMFFVVALLIIAFATILGIEKYEWKKGLVKLIAMAILINFSNLIAQVIIDVAHVFTITFLNAISASAGGNLINMFDLAEINTMVHGRELGSDMQQANYAIFGAAVLALIFSVITAVTLGAYAIVMAARVVVLWALIILSPLAYLLSALPDGDKYASKWWSEFNRHVIVAPVMVFFLWLAFATFGSGNIMAEISKSATVPLDTGSIPTSISLLEVSTWENMASFILGIIFLVIGLKMTQETGATASGMVSAAVDWGKKVATIASGYALGRWMVGKGVEGAKFGSKATGKYLYDKTGASSLVGRAKAGWQNRKANRIMNSVETTKKLEEKARNAKNAGKGIKSFLYSTGAMITQPVQRASKQAEDWKKAADAFKEKWEESLSTSDTRAGQVKQRAYSERDEVKSKAQEKIRQKQQEQKALAASMQEQMTLRLEAENRETLDASLAPRLGDIDKVAEKELSSIDGSPAQIEKFLEHLKAEEIREIENNEKLNSAQKLKMKDDVEKKYEEKREKRAKPETQVETEALIISDYKKSVLDTRDKDKDKLRSDQNVLEMNFDGVANTRIAALDLQRKSGEIKDDEYEKKKVEIIASRDLSKGIQKKLKEDKDFVASQEKIDSMPKGTPAEEKAKAVALAKLKAEQAKKFQKEFQETYADTLLQTRESEFFSGAALKMAGGDEKGAKKKESVLRRFNSVQDVWRYSKFVSNEQSTQANAAAVAEEIGKYSRQKQELGTAKARDRLRIAQKKTVVFEEQAKEKHFKENKEEMDALNYRQITKQGGIIAQKIAEALRINSKAIIDPSLRENLASIMASAAARGSEEAGAAMTEILGAVGFDEKISANDMLGQQRQILSVLLGRNVSVPAGESESITVQKAYEEFVSSHGDDKAQAILKYIDSTFKNAGGDGLLHIAAAFDDKNLDKNGRVQIRMERSNEGFNNTKNYWAERQKSASLTGIDGIVNQDISGTLTINVIDSKGNRGNVVDKTAKNTLVKTLNAIKTNTQLTSAMKKQLSDWYSSHEDEYNEVVSELSPESVNALAAVIKKTKSTT